MLDNLKTYNVVLASNSPRRKELLQRLGVPFKVRTLLGIDESYPEELDLSEVAEYISKNKADGYRKSMMENDLTITADTIVVVGDEVLGKPHNIDEAKDMLHRLAGRYHMVYTGVTVFTADKQESFTAHSRVKFAQLTDEEINYYVENYLPLDKAGAYGIQDWIGLIAVEEIEGSYFNVVGLPIQRLYSLLKKF